MNDGKPSDQRSGRRSGDDAGAPELSRELGYLGVLTTASGTMIGAGIFILPGIAAAGAGPAAAVSFLLAGIIAAIATLSTAELATAMPRAGGPYFFVSRAMGPLLGTIVGLGAWLALILKGSFALVGLGQYIHHFTYVPVLVTAAGGGLLLVAVNWMGTRFSGVLQNVIVVALLAIVGAFVGAGFFAMDRELLTPFFHFGWSGVFATTGLVFISYLGIVKAAAVAEEVRDPSRILPLGLLSSVVLVTVLYVLVMLVVTGVLPIEAGDVPIDAREAPLADAGALFLGAAGGVLVGIAGILATVSTGNAAVLSSARFPFAMARDGLMTEWLQHLSPRFRTPGRAIWITGGIMLALALLLDVERLAKLGGTFGILVFSLINLSVVLLRRASPRWYDPPFKAPLYPFLQVGGAVAALSLIPQMGTFSQVGTLVFIGLGVAWYVLQERTGRPVSPRYGLREQLRRVGHQRSLEAKRRARSAREEAAGEEEGPTGRIVVELVPEMPNELLLTIAAGLARQSQVGVEALLVSEVPEQVPLSKFGPPIPEEWVEKSREQLRAHGVPAKLRRVVTRNRDRALLSRVDSGTRLLLVDWHEPLRIHRLRDSHVDRLLQRSPVRLAVLKHRPPSRLEEIMVASGGGPYERMEVEVADAVAGTTGARLTFLKVLPLDASEERVRNAREYMAKLQELVDAPSRTRIVRGADVADTLVRASRDADLLVLGASREPRYRRTVFGGIADRVAARSPVSVLITKDPDAPGPLKRFLLRRILSEE